MTLDHDCAYCGDVVEPWQTVDPEAQQWAHQRCEDEEKQFMTEMAVEHPGLRDCLVSPPR